MFHVPCRSRWRRRGIAGWTFHIVHSSTNLSQSTNPFLIFSKRTLFGTIFATLARYYAPVGPIFDACSTKAFIIIIIIGCLGIMGFLSVRGRLFLLCFATRADGIGIWDRTQIPRRCFCSVERAAYSIFVALVYGPPFTPFVPNGVYPTPATISTDREGMTTS